MRSNIFLIPAVFLTLQVNADTLTVPATPTSLSVTGVLKQLLSKRLQKEGPQTADHKAKLHGDNRQVTLADKNHTLSCVENPKESFACEVRSIKGTAIVRQMNLDWTTDAGSVQAILGKLLSQGHFSGKAGKDVHFSITKYQNEVILEDDVARLACEEDSNIWDTQQYFCSFELK